MANDLAMQWERNDVGLSGSRAALVEAVVGARLVIVDQELLDHSLQMAGAENEQVIEHLSPAGADEPFADRVRPRGTEGQLHTFDAFRAEDLIEAERELGVAVPEQEAGLEGAGPDRGASEAASPASVAAMAGRTSGAAG